MVKERSVTGWAIRLLAAWLCGGVAPAQQSERLDFDAALAKYRANLTRPSLSRRIEGRRLLATSNDPRVFGILVADYADPEDPRDFVRALIVTLLADFHRSDFHRSDFHRSEAGAEPWREWRTSLPKAEHAWLWYRALCVESVDDPGAWRPVAADRRLPIELRGAALAAGAARKDGALLDSDTRALVMDLAGSPGGRSGDRAVVLEGLAGLFGAGGGELDPAQRSVLRSLVSVMGERATAPRSRIVMARALARALGRDDIGPDVDCWLTLTSDSPAAEIELAYATKRAAVKAGFFGIPEHGRSIAYVIDASDSMLEPLTPRELGDLQPLTGSAAPGGDPGVGAQAEQAIDWSRVQTRFDGARELLKLALRRLPPDATFTVVLFGDRADYLEATRGLVKVSSKVVEAACAEVDAIRPGPRTGQRPHGTLRGATNVHGGFLCAFRAGDAKKTRANPKKPKRSGRRASDAEAADGESQVQLDERGVDTIYLLSDGDPSADDWPGSDTNDGTTVGDPETRTTKEHTGRVIYPGPFSWAPYLIPDLRRLNLLQRASIHTIGLGEADYALLERIAEVGHGTVVRIGRK